MVPIVPVQCWVARTALEWSERRLARAAGVSTGVVRDFERAGSVRATSVAAVQHARENAGVVFIDANDGGPGARLRKAD